MGDVRHVTEDAPATAKVAVREVAVAIGIPTFGRDAGNRMNLIHPDKSRKTAAGLSQGAGYGNNTGLSGPRSAAWLS